MGYQLSSEDMDAMFSTGASSSPQPVTAAPSRQLDTAQPVVSEAMLDNLMRMESGGDPKAYNKKTGATGAYQFTPITMRQFKKMGLTVDPRDPVSSRAGAKALLELYARESGGDLDAALTRYGGFKTKDPAAYLAGVRGDSSSPDMAPTSVPSTTRATPGMNSLFGQGNVPEFLQGADEEADRRAALLAGGKHGLVQPLAGAIQGTGKALGWMERQLGGREENGWGDTFGQVGTDWAKKNEEAIAPAKKAYPWETNIGEGIGLYVNPINKIFGKSKKLPKIGEVAIGETPSLTSAVASGVGQAVTMGAVTQPVTDESKSYAAEKAQQIPLNAFGGAIGTGLVKGIGKIGELLNPGRTTKEGAESVKTLLDNGVQLDKAQMTQNHDLLRRKSAWFDHPATMTAAKQAQGEQLRQFTGAVAKQMGETSDNITPAVLQSAKQRLGKNYDYLENKYGVQITPSVMKELRNVQAEAMSALSPSDYALFKRSIFDTVTEKMEYNSGQWANGLDGAQLKQVKKVLQHHINSNPKLAGFSQDIKEVFEMAHGKNITSVADKKLFELTNQQYGNYKAIEKVASRDANGNVSPSRLWQEIVGRSKKFLYYRKDDRLLELARAGKNILEEKLPNSGTPSRWRALYPPLGDFLTEVKHRGYQQKYGGLHDTIPERTLTNDMGEYLTKASDLIPRPGILGGIAANRRQDIENQTWRNKQEEQRNRR